MTRAYVLKSFKSAGFPLKECGGYNRFEYYSSVVRIIYVGDHLPLRVYFGSRLSEFDTVASALRCIRGRMAMTVVGGSDYALRTEPRASLYLVEVAS